MGKEECAAYSEDHSPGPLQACSGCRKVWYCSKQCQEEHWEHHIFDCETKKPINPVFYLARACREDLVPTDPRTRTYYGFVKAERLLGGDGEGRLGGLYQGLIGVLEVPLKDLRRWQKEGTLIENIKAAFETLPPGSRGGYYSWFLENTHILDGKCIDEVKASAAVKDRADTMLRAGWILTGGSPHDSVTTIRCKLQSMPTAIAHCHAVYAYATSSGHPGPYDPLWRTFGFVATPSQYVEIEYGRAYRQLAHLCPFKEFCEAYEARQIPSLFDKYHISLHEPRHLFRDVMSSFPSKSVWDLKHYIDWTSTIAADSTEKPRLIPSVFADYGFMNCKNDKEHRMLVVMYTKLFSKMMAGMDPLALHEACIQGKLLDFVRGFVTLEPYTAKYTRLLWNVYPLREPEY